MKGTQKLALVAGSVVLAGAGYYAYRILTTPSITILNATYTGHCKKQLNVTGLLQAAVNKAIKAGASVSDLSIYGKWKKSTDPTYEGSTDLWNSDFIGPQVCPHQHRYVIVQWMYNGIPQPKTHFAWGQPLNFTNRATTV